MNLILEYLELTKVCALTDYADKKSVKMHNKFVERMSTIVEQIGNNGTAEIIEEFSNLLDISDSKTNLWTAVHILENIHTDKKTQEKALNIIKREADGDSAEAMGFKIWLKNYQNK